MQYLDSLIPNLIPNLVNSGPKLVEIVDSCFYHIGRYCNVSAYRHVFKSAFAGEYVAEDGFVGGAVRALGRIVAGSKFDL